MIACAYPRCVECGLPLPVVEPFIGGAWQQLRCGGCGVHLQVRRAAASGDAWQVRLAGESARQAIATLPAVASPQLRERFLGACRHVARLLHPADGVEPGMSTLEVAHHD